MPNDDTPAERQTGGTPRGGDGRFTRSPDTAERDAEAARLRARGQSYRAIGEALGISQGSAHDAVQRALRATVAEAAADARALELERLDALYEAAMAVLEREHVTVSNGKVIRLNGEPLPDDAPVLAAIDRLLRVSESRRKLLGLDAPARLKAEVSADRTARILDLAAQLSGDDPTGGAP